MERQYIKLIVEEINRKINLISGPRQAGKTTVTKMLKKDYDYLNFDAQEHREILREKSWDRKKELVIFDELHKMRKWKSWLKGIYDTETRPPAICATGSARLNLYKKVGDSLAGRYFSYRMHPLDIRELNRIKSSLKNDEIIERILNVGGFPEPFIENKKSFYNRWKKSHLDIILRQDLIELENIRDIKSIEILIDLLKERAGSTVSYVSLSRDLQVSDKTIKKWLTILEDMFVLFKITPYNRNIARSNLKRPKYYFFDVAQVLDKGARLENLVACTLLKECHYRQDFLGEDWHLFYLAKKDGFEIDFLLVKDKKPKLMIEVKSTDDKPSFNFKKFEKDLPNVAKVQIVKDLKREKTFPNNLEIRKLANWLAKCDF